MQTKWNLFTWKDCFWSLQDILNHGRRSLNAWSYGSGWWCHNGIWIFIQVFLIHFGLGLKQENQNLYKCFWLNEVDWLSKIILSGAWKRNFCFWKDNEMTSGSTKIILLDLCWNDYESAWWNGKKISKKELKDSSFRIWIWIQTWISAFWQFGRRHWG